MRARAQIIPLETVGWKRITEHGRRAIGHGKQAIREVGLALGVVNEKVTEVHWQQVMRTTKNAAAALKRAASDAPQDPDFAKYQADVGLLAEEARDLYERVRTLKSDLDIDRAAEADDANEEPANEPTSGKRGRLAGRQ
jgi:alpha-L-fucosidase